MKDTQITFRLQHLSLSPERQKALLEELERANPEQQKAMEKILDDYEEETIAVLNQRLEEKRDLKKEVPKKSGIQAPKVNPEMDKIQELIRFIFASPEHFGIFLADANDEVIEAVEFLITGFATKEKKEKIQKFFQEVRVHKSFVEQHKGEAYRQVLIKELEKKDQQIKELDSLIALVEKDIQKNKNKT